MVVRRKGHVEERGTFVDVPSLFSTTLSCMAAGRRALAKWCEAQGIYIDPRLDIVNVSDTDTEWASSPGSMAVTACRPIPAGDVVVRIPCHALLCARTSALHAYPAFQQLLSSEKLSLCLALCVLYEQSLGAQSYFAPYVHSFSPVSLPFQWTSAWAGNVWFRGTEASRLVKRREYAWHQGSGATPGMCYVSTVGTDPSRSFNLFGTA